jgi:hypothetical protein
MAILNFQQPDKIVLQKATDFEAQFEFRPLEPGYGVTIDNNYFSSGTGCSGTGSGNITPTAPFNKGRTGTHEVGHWLNLRHIWGDANCGNDQVTDTPTQQTSNYGCPSFPKVTCSNGPNGDMFMNYMDYCDDICLTMFTTGQVAVMQAEVSTGGESYSLTQNNNICNWPAAIPSLQGTTPIQVAPNPCTQYCNVSYNEQPTQINVINTLGVQVWSAAPSAIGNTNTFINTQTLASGIYYIHVQFKDAMQAPGVKE